MFPRTSCSLFIFNVALLQAQKYLNWDGNVLSIHYIYFQFEIRISFQTLKYIEDFHWLIWMYSKVSDVKQEKEVGIWRF